MKWENFTAAAEQRLLDSSASVAAAAADAVSVAADAAAAAEAAEPSSPSGRGAHLLLLAGLLAGAVIIAVIAAILVTSSSAASSSSEDKKSAGKKRRLRCSMSGSSSCLEARSALSTRRSSAIDRAKSREGSLAMKFASTEQLDRVDVVDDVIDAVDGAQHHLGAADDEVDGIDGRVELRFCTKLDLADGLLYLHGFRLRFHVRPATSQLSQQHWRTIIDIGDSGTSSTSQRWSIEAGLSRRGSQRRGRPVPASAWQTDVIDYVASLRLNVGRLSAQLPHQRRLRIRARAVERPDDSGDRSLQLGAFEFPLHLVNEPLMEFAARVQAGLAGAGEEAGRTEWQQLRPPQLPVPHLSVRPPRLHLGLLYSPGPRVSAVCVRLIEVFDLDASRGVPVTAAVSLASADQTQSSAEAPKRLLARSSDSRSAHIFDQSQPAPVLAIDNARMQAATVGVVVYVAVGSGEQRTVGRVLLGDFALANCSSAMRQWTAAVGKPNTWVWLTHACR